MVADDRSDACVGSSPANHLVGVDAAHRVRGQLPRLLPRRAKKRAFRLVLDARGFYVLVQILLGIVMNRNLVKLSAFFVQSYPVALSVRIIILNLHLYDRADPRETVSHQCD